MKNRLRAIATSLPVIVAFALGVRLFSFWHYVSGHSHHALGILPFLFESGNIAYSLASGSGFGSPFRVVTGPTAWMTPVYPMTLAGIFRIFGFYTFAAFVAGALLNILFATLVTIPLFFAARKVGGPGLAAAAGWLWAIFPNAILLTYQSMWGVCIAALLAAAILWATFALADDGRWKYWCGYGLLWGFTLMTDPTLASLLPLLLGWLVYCAIWRASGAEQAHRNGKIGAGKRVFGKSALALAIAILCCVPWTIRNYRVFHTFVPLRSVLGLQLWLGNNPQAGPIWHARLHPINNSAERAEYVRMGEIAYMHQKMHLALGYMLTHPRHEIELIGRRFLAIWAGGTPYPVRDFLANHSLWFRYVLLFNLLAGLGAAVGIVVLFWKRNVYAFPLAVFPIVYPWAYYLTLAEPRYGLPMEPAVLLLAGAAIAGLAGWGKMGQARTVAE